MKKEISSHKDLRVWRKAARLARECLAVVSSLPESAMPLGKRIRRKVESIPYEIERGHQFQQLAPYLHHLHRARSRVEALEPLLIEGCGRSWILDETGDQLLRLTAEIHRMLGKQIVSLEAAGQRRRRRLVWK
jgi:four helix bundle protein